MIELGVPPSLYLPLARGYLPTVGVHPVTGELLDPDFPSPKDYPTKRADVFKVPSVPVVPRPDGKGPSQVFLPTRIPEAMLNDQDNIPDARDARPEHVRWRLVVQYLARFPIMDIDKASFIRMVRASIRLGWPTPQDKLPAKQRGITEPNGKMASPAQLAAVPAIVKLSSRKHPADKFQPMWTEEMVQTMAAFYSAFIQRYGDESDKAFERDFTLPDGRKPGSSFGDAGVAAKRATAKACDHEIYRWGMQQADIVTYVDQPSGQPMHTVVLGPIERFALANQFFASRSVLGPWFALVSAARSHGFQSRAAAAAAPLHLRRLRHRGDSRRRIYRLCRARRCGEAWASQQGAGCVVGPLVRAQLQGRTRHGAGSHSGLCLRRGTQIWCPVRWTKKEHDAEYGRVCSWRDEGSHIGCTGLQGLTWLCKERPQARHRGCA